MQKNFSWFILLILTTFLIPINSISQSQENSFLYQTSSSTSSTSSSTSSSGGGVQLESYIIIDGPGAGTTIFATKDAPTVIVEANNPTTKANGHVGGIGEGEGMNCPGPLGHFHGTLKGANDPAEDMCGWGHTLLSSQASTGIMSISTGVSNESLIISLIEKDPPDYSGAVMAADQSSMDLTTLQEDIRDPNKTMIGKGKARQISDKLGKAISADKFVTMLLDPLPQARDGEKDVVITFKINEALKAKQDALMILFEAETMAAAMAGMAMGG